MPAFAAAVYGTEAKLRKAFGLKVKDTEKWRVTGIPRGHQLGMYMSLRVRGAEPAPRLFGIKSWLEFPGT